MTIEFMVLSAPRSASTWVANWLTTDVSLCIHDPLLKYHYSEFDKVHSPRMLGISCTGTALFPEWVNAHPARKVVLHRDLDEVDASLTRIGLSPCRDAWEGVLDRIGGMHMDWRDVFARPQVIYEFLLRRPFDIQRHSQLCEMNIQPNLGKVSIDRAATARFIRELESARAN